MDSSGQIWIFGVGGDPASGQPAIVYVTSNDGGGSFSTVKAAAVGIHFLGGLPGNPFRAETIPTSCAVGNQVVVAWADSREPDAHVYYRRTNNSGKSWLGSGSGDLLTAASPSAPGQADIMPQIHPRRRSRLLLLRVRSQDVGRSTFDPRRAGGIDGRRQDLPQSCACHRPALLCMAGGAV
ncbi:MAG TPA: hypothetical protein VGU71_06635 [Candidatus Dormibacteraeota bacterium]|nr:hypothetical protein [Candidatus Dormibacteraeota bacterium]